MSYPGRQVVDHLDAGELQLAFWLRYSDRLTPDERERIVGGDYKAVRRELRPTWRPGQWLKVTPKLSIQIRDVSFAGQSYRTRIAEVQDHRGGRAVDRRLHEDPANMTTIVPINDWPVDPPEPEKVPDHEIGTYRGDMLARQRYQRAMAERDADFRAQPVELRLARLRQLARERHVDISSEERVLERRIAALERKLRDAA